MIVFVVVGSWWLEFAFRLNVLRNPRRVLTTIAAVAPVFLVWDGYAISQGHWFFDPALTLGVVGPLGIPLEEYLFFIVVPVASILTLEGVSAFAAWASRKFFTSARHSAAP
jgi:lycopene cyclase domain-containing protein